MGSEQHVDADWLLKIRSNSNYHNYCIVILTDKLAGVRLNIWWWICRLLIVSWQATKRQSDLELLDKNTDIPVQQLMVNITWLHNVLTTWSTVLERLTVLQTVKKFLIFYGTLRFIAITKKAQCLSLSSATSSSCPPNRFLEHPF